MFEQNVTACSFDFERKLASGVSDDTCSRLKTLSRERTICFKMQSNGHFCFAPYVQVFKKFICVLIDLFKACYNY